MKIYAFILALVLIAVGVFFFYPSKFGASSTTTIPGNLNVAGTITSSGFSATSTATFVDISATTVTTTNLLGSTTSTFGVNNGSTLLISRTSVSSTFDFSATGTCFVVRTKLGLKVYYTFGTDGFTSSTTPCI